MQTSQASPQQRRPSPTTRAIQLPPPPSQRLTAAQVGAVMKRARKLGRRDVLTPYDHRLLDALLFQCRSPSTGAVVVSYTRLAQLTGMARATIAKSIARLTGCGLLEKIKRRLRVSWHQGGTASLQATNAYRFNPPADNTEFAARPVIQKLEITYISQQVRAEAREAQESLNAVNRRRAIRRDAEHQAKVTAAQKLGRYIAS